ncbi:MAG: CsgG/HfaB family protein [Candidatus Binatia bacterium]
MDFEDRTGQQVNRRRSLLGRGMEAQLATALHQTGQFTVLEPSEKTVRNRRGNPITARVGRIDEPEFFISGSVTLYQLSPASVAAGVHADPLLGTAQPLAESFQAEAAQRTFANVASNDRDRIQIILRMFDGQTGQVVDETQITTTAKDFSLNLDGMFSTVLLQSAVPTEPASQQAVRASVIRAVNWLGETCQEYRRQRVSETPQGTGYSPEENSR